MRLILPVFSTIIAPGKYNQVGLAMYELPSCVLAWMLFLVRPRGAIDAVELAGCGKARCEHEVLVT